MSVKQESVAAWWPCKTCGGCGRRRPWKRCCGWSPCGWTRIVPAVTPPRPLALQVWPSTQAQIQCRFINISILTSLKDVIPRTLHTDSGHLLQFCSSKYLYSITCFAIPAIISSLLCCSNHPKYSPVSRKWDRNCSSVTDCFYCKFSAQFSMDNLELAHYPYYKKSSSSCSKRFASLGRPYKF